MSRLLKIHNKYNIKYLFEFVHLDIVVKIIKYNKYLLNLIELTKEEGIIILLMEKIVKPIANVEDYIPIIKRIASKEIIFNKFNKEDYLISLFSKFLNLNSKFIPSINFKCSYRKFFDLLNKIKICFNTNLIELFYDEVYDFGSSTLLEYVYSYAKKIKQISFLDSDIDYKAYMKEETAFYIIKLFTINSNVEKIEDRYFEDNTTTNFLKIFDSKYSEDRLNIYENEYKELKRQYDVLDIIKGLKSYSLYFDLYDSNIIQNVCDNIIAFMENNNNKMNIVL